MSTESAILKLRRDPKYAELLRDCYLTEDLFQSANDFYRSVEFAQVRSYLGPRLTGATVLDVGAGNGIASYAFARAGADKVFAVEPDPSHVVGSGAIRELAKHRPIDVLTGDGASVPLPDHSVNIVYARQVLHHIYDLPAALKEFWRVLTPGGSLITCRDHVVDDDRQLQQFLARHLVHQMVGGEHAHSLSTYLRAITEAGFVLDNKLGPWDSVINAFPHARTEAELAAYPEKMLRQQLGKLAPLAKVLPGVKRWFWRRWRRVPRPGRMYSFFASKPYPWRAEPRKRA